MKKTDRNEMLFTLQEVEELLKDALKTRTLEKLSLAKEEKITTKTEESLGLCEDSPKRSYSAIKWRDYIIEEDKSTELPPPISNLQL
jgi:predicted aminopeptidase